MLVFVEMLHAHAHCTQFSVLVLKTDHYAFNIDTKNDKEHTAYTQFSSYVRLHRHHRIFTTTTAQQ